MTIDDNVRDFKNLALSLSSDEEEQIVRLFLGSKDEHDDLNYRIAANAVRGFNTIEYNEYGIPLEMFVELSLWRQIALFAGIGMINQKDVRDLGRLPLGKQVTEISKSAYVMGGKDFAANALFIMKKKGLGYGEEKDGSVEERVGRIKNLDAKLQFLRSLYIPEIAKRSFPGRGEYQRVSSPGIKRNDSARPSYAERESMARQLIRFLKAKEPKPYVINPNGTFREGWIVPVEDKKGKREYFVQRNDVYIPGLTNGKMEVYNCNCAAGWPKLISATTKALARKPCTHVNEVQLKYAA